MHGDARRAGCDGWDGEIEIGSEGGLGRRFGEHEGVGGGWDLVAGEFFGESGGTRGSILWSGWMSRVCALISHVWSCVYARVMRGEYAFVFYVIVRMYGDEVGRDLLGRGW